MLAVHRARLGYETRLGYERQAPRDILKIRSMRPEGTRLGYEKQAPRYVLNLPLQPSIAISRFDWTRLD